MEFIPAFLGVQVPFNLDFCERVRNELEQVGICLSDEVPVLTLVLCAVS